MMAFFEAAVLMVSGKKTDKTLLETQDQNALASYRSRKPAVEGDGPLFIPTPHYQRKR